MHLFFFICLLRQKKLDHLNFEPKMQIMMTKYHIYLVGQDDHDSAEDVYKIQEQINRVPMGYNVIPVATLHVINYYLKKFNDRNEIFLFYCHSNLRSIETP